ncbi:hypothetical protein [Micromonospora sp. AMSO31t]|uniref:hypothetical protein n=1 Tax=Micromonospora sp. AMSO31t TaxID=2650566 RepID=UPI00124B2BEF|nr:hypothetical protein [Micromonospora sp. AMSO31t]KAB1912349.1 hypothetical protein F8274_14265 [Micromonospora sp. AMSO31t]
MSAAELERRYRRLLAVHPWEHRRVYEEEMVAVLLADARPGQTRPGFRDTVDLIGAGLRARLRVGARGFTEPAWADAAAVTGVLVALVLCAAAGRNVLDHLLVDPSLPPPLRAVAPDVVDWLRVAGWAAVAVTALVGLRRLAAGLAWVGVGGWLVLVRPGVGDQPTYVVDTLPQFALALVAAAALTVPAPARRAVAVLGVRRLAVLVAACLAVVSILAVSRLARPPFQEAAADYPVYVLYDLEARSELVIWLYVAGLAAAAVAAVAVLATLDRPVRRRIAVLLAPVVALALVIDTALAGWAASTVHMGHAIALVPAQWLMLVLVPPVTFLAGVLLVRRREETLRMVALGRAADRERPAG